MSTPAPARRRFAVSQLVLALATLDPRAQAPTPPPRVPELPRPALIELLARETVPVAVTAYPVSVEILPLAIDPDAGWKGLRNRYDANRAFREEYRLEFVAGLRDYLARTGFEIKPGPESLGITVTVLEFDGRRRTGNYGGDFYARLALELGRVKYEERDLFGTVTIPDSAVAVREFREKYGADGATFDTVLFYRLALQQYEGVVQALIRSEAAALRPESNTLFEDIRESVSPNTGALTVVSEPPGAEVFIGEKFVGSTPTGALPLPAGDHRVTVKLGGHADWVRTVTVLAKGDQTVRATLVPSKPPK